MKRNFRTVSVRSGPVRSHTVSGLPWLADFELTAPFLARIVLAN